MSLVTPSDALADLAKMLETTAFAARAEDGRVIVDPAKAYPLYFNLLGEPPATQYWMEVARMCFTQDLIEVYGKPLHLVITKNPAFALVRFPRGDGPEAGQAGFRVHWNKLNARRRLAGA